MNRPKIKDYKTISGPGAYDYVADMNIYIDQLEIRLKNKDKIESISDERANGDGFWIYLKIEYADLYFDPFWNCRIIHEETITECIERLRSSKKITKDNTNEK